MRTRASGRSTLRAPRGCPACALFGLMKRDQPVLAADVVRYVGEPVALVAAEDIDQAKAAARAIAVEYEPLRPVTDPVAALQKGAPSCTRRGTSSRASAWR